MTAPSRGRGRPTQITPAQVGAYLAQLRRGASKADAAAKAGVNARTIRHHARTHPEVAAAVAEAHAAGRWVGKPHDAYRYRHQPCRCPRCTADATAQRAGRHRSPRAPQTTGAEVVRLPVAAVQGPVVPLRAAG